MQAARERMQRAGGRNLTVLTTTARSVIGQGPAEDEEAKKKRIQAATDEEVHSRYRLGGQVMESTHAGMDVIYCTRLSDGLECVTKTIVKREFFKTARAGREWRTTMEYQLNMPKSDLLCTCLEVFETKEKCYVFMEKCEGKDLFEQLAARKRMAQVDAREIMRQILEALRIMHVKGRVHKDLKLENVMVDLPRPGSPRAMQILAKRRSSGSPCSGSPTPSEAASPVEVKLIDFDTVEGWEPSSPKARDVLGTDGYIAPEAYLGEYSPASDVYAAGVMMYKLLTGKLPSPDTIFDDKPGENWVGSPQMKAIHERLRKVPIDFTRPPLDRCPEAADLASKLLAFERADRLSADDALKHPWFFLDLPADTSSPR